MSLRQLIALCVASALLLGAASLSAQVVIDLRYSNTVAQSIVGSASQKVGAI